MYKDFVRQLSHHDALKKNNSFCQRLNIDPVLYCALLGVCIGGLFILYSASDKNMMLVLRQSVYMLAGLVMTFIIAQINPERIQHAVIVLYPIGIAILLIVLIAGSGAKGATRWISLPGIRFQPSEIFKIIMPLTLAAYLNKHPLPCNYKQIFFSLVLTAIPCILIAKQPDLGTALLVASSSIFILFLAGFNLRYISILCILSIPICWIMWHFLMHGYQKQRVLTFLNPERDPLGSGWHIIQAKIAIGSGGIYGKGFLNGSQSHLNFLPERSTDFIFAVLAEEFGLIGIMFLLLAYTLIILRCLYITIRSHSTFTRLAAGGLTLTFALYVIVNIGMVSGVLPVVGVPLPLVSRGGTSILSLMAGFGILMSIHTHRHLMSSN